MELWIGDSCLSKEATWEEALDGLRQILPATPVSLVRTDSTALKAQGAKAKFTLHLCKPDDDNHLIIGRHLNEARRGHMTIRDNFIISTPWELWSVAQAEDVFRVFYFGEEFVPKYTLRDTSILFSDDEIREFPRV